MDLILNYYSTTFRTHYKLCTVTPVGSYVMLLYAFWVNINISTIDTLTLIIIILFECRCHHQLCFVLQWDRRQLLLRPTLPLVVPFEHFFFLVGSAASPSCLSGLIRVLSSVFFRSFGVLFWVTIISLIFAASTTSFTYYTQIDSFAAFSFSNSLSLFCFTFFKLSMPSLTSPALNTSETWENNY